jgi:hypothetical protein
MTIEKYSGQDTQFPNQEAVDNSIAHQLNVAISTSIRDWYKNHYFTFNTLFPAGDRDSGRPYEREDRLSTQLIFTSHWSALQYLHGRKSGTFEPNVDSDFQALLQEANIHSVLEIGPGPESLLFNYEELLGKGARLAWIGDEGPFEYPKIATRLFPDSNLHETFDLIVSKGVWSTGGGYEDATKYMLAAHKHLSQNPHAVAIHTGKIRATINVAGLKQLEEQYPNQFFWLPPDRSVLPQAGFSKPENYTDLVMTSPHFASHT